MCAYVRMDFENNPYDRVRGYQQVCLVDVDVYGTLFFVDVDGTLSDFMRTILVYLFCGEKG